MSISAALAGYDAYQTTLAVVEGSQTHDIVMLSTIGIAVTPAGAEVVATENQPFGAAVSGLADSSVTWQASGGTIDANGLYTAPSLPGDYTITATSVSHPDRTASVPVRVVPPTIVVAPTTADITLGTTQAFTAEARGAADGAMPGVQFAWSVEPAALGQIDASGVFTPAVTSGTGVVRATALGGSSTSAVNLLMPPTLRLDLNLAAPQGGAPVVNDAVTLGTAPNASEDFVFGEDAHTPPVPPGVNHVLVRLGPDLNRDIRGPIAAGQKTWDAEVVARAPAADTPLQLTVTPTVAVPYRVIDVDGALGLAGAAVTAPLAWTAAAAQDRTWTFRISVP